MIEGVLMENDSGTALSRRRLLGAIAGLFILRALPSREQPGSAAISPVMTRLSSYMAKAHVEALPDDVIEQTKCHVLDTLAAMLSGSRLCPGVAAIDFARANSKDRTATVVASNVRCSASEAALINGMLAHSDETDDSHAPSQSHPGCAVVPSALAAAEQLKVDGTSFLRAVTLGYDIGTRVTLTFGGPKFQTDTHRSTHALAGLFGAAAAAGSIMHLTAQQMRWLLDYSAQQASGIAAWQRDTEHIEKAFVFAGMPARGGITAALLVHSGWTGVDDILAGPDNFIAAFAPLADPAGLIDQLGERYEITRTNIKKWTVGSPIQAPLDALEDLRAKYGFDASQVQSVTVRVATQEAAVVDNREMPDICLQHLIAVILVDKTVTFDSAHDRSRMQDPTILRVRNKVKLIPDQELDRLLPQRVAVVEVALGSGRTLMKRVDAVRGTAQNPMTRDEVIAKCRDLAIPVLGAGDVAKLIDCVFALESEGSFHKMIRLLSASNSVRIQNRRPAPCP